jgi:hypothetical protein
MSLEEKMDILEVIARYAYPWDGLAHQKRSLKPWCGSAPMLPRLSLGTP